MKKSLKKIYQGDTVFCVDSFYCDVTEKLCVIKDFEIEERRGPIHLQRYRYYYGNMLLVEKKYPKKDRTFFAINTYKNK